MSDDSSLEQRARELASLLHVTVLGLDYDQDEIDQMALRIEHHLAEFAQAEVQREREEIAVICDEQSDFEHDDYAAAACAGLACTIRERAK